MKYPVFRVLDSLLVAGIFVLAVYTLLMLFTGGTFQAAYGIKIRPRPIPLAISLLLVLVVLRLPVKHRAVSRQVFFSHQGLILFSVFLIIYLASNCSPYSSRDTYPARYLPLSILRHGNFYLDEFQFLYADGTPYFLQIVDGHYVSDYPVGAALLALPFYVPSALGRVSPQDTLFCDLEKLSAAVIVALSAVVLCFTLRRLTGRRMALLITVVYALGTSSLSTSSQALWQHGPSQLALAATLWCLVRGRSNSAWIALAGFPLAFAVISRPTDLLIAVPLSVYVLVYHRRYFWGFLLSGLPPALFQLWYNTAYFLNPLRTQFPILGKGSWSARFWEGLPGILVSPGRGLFVYSPIFIVSLLGMVLAWRRSGEPLLRYSSIGALLTVLLYSKWWVWWGGWTYGPRLLADLSPLLALVLYPLDDLLQKSRSLHRIFVLSLVWSMGAHAIGAFWSDPFWNVTMDVDRFPQHLWSWTNNQLVNPPRRLLDLLLTSVRHLPTSRTAPERLSASYAVNLSPTLTTPASKPIPLAIRATNAGAAVWLAWPRDSNGSVKLLWRWSKRGQQVPGMLGLLFLVYDVFPGQSHDFWTEISSPSEPGVYVLELGLVAGPGAAFSDRSSLPVKIAVTVAAITELMPSSQGFHGGAVRPAVRGDIPKLPAICCDQRLCRKPLNG